MSQGVTVQGRSEQELMEPPGELELSGSGAPGQGVWVINGLGLVRVAAQPLCQECLGKGGVEELGIAAGSAGKL